MCSEFSISAYLSWNDLLTLRVGSNILRMFSGYRRRRHSKPWWDDEMFRILSRSLRGSES